MTETQTRRPELPARVYKKDRIFYKGLFVAANVKIDEDGTPLFGQVDSEKVQWMKETRRCQLCGQRIARTDWCVFPGSIELWQYIEAPLHTECAGYSALVCPRIQRVKSSFGFSVCMEYVLDGDEVTPIWPNLKPWQEIALAFAHDIRYDAEKPYCATCPEWNNNLGKLTFDEYMSKWVH